jgi:hypothetical protein
VDNYASSTPPRTSIRGNADKAAGAASRTAMLRIMVILHYDGTPIAARFIAWAIGDSLDALKVAPLRMVSRSSEPTSYCLHPRRF